MVLAIKVTEIDMYTVRRRILPHVDLFAQLLLVRDYEAIGSLFADTKYFRSGDV